MVVVRSLWLWHFLTTLLTRLIRNDLPVPHMGRTSIYHYVFSSLKLITTSHFIIAATQRSLFAITFDNL